MTGKGVWLFFETIDFASTEDQIVTFFRAHGINIERGDIQQNTHGTIVSISDEAVLDLVNGALHDDPLVKWPTVARKWVRQPRRS